MKTEQEFKDMIDALSTDEKIALRKAFYSYLGKVSAEKRLTNGADQYRSWLAENLDKANKERKRLKKLSTDGLANS